MESLRVVLLGILLCVICTNYTVADDCTKINSCSCNSSEGTIDLSALGNNDGSAKYLDQPDADGSWQFSYNPCHSFTEGTCSDVAACQVSTDASQFYSIGTQDSAQFKKDSDGNVMIEYSATDQGTQRTTQVSLVCDKSSDDTLKAMTLTSKHCCPSGGKPGPGPTVTTSLELSIGTILCMAFVGLLIVYIGVGIAIQKGVRKAQGKEVIPNYSLWSSVPGLVKDGVKFTVTCGKGSPSYSKI
ncbi:hypothetical protein BaRGS_00020440 [Batillaria attramentaria]|uniref:Autophagy-related protein 27 n=1 Tax=Batillaria attramentaria TaxID=370345 RepID=A0ABD0KMG5_9CAEN